jgi:hypothetical protein
LGGYVSVLCRFAKRQKAELNGLGRTEIQISEIGQKRTIGNEKALQAARAHGD